MVFGPAETYRVLCAVGLEDYEFRKPTPECACRLSAHNNESMRTMAVETEAVKLIRRVPSPSEITRELLGRAQISIVRPTNSLGDAASAVPPFES